VLTGLLHATEAYERISPRGRRAQTAADVVGDLQGDVHLEFGGDGACILIAVPRAPQPRHQRSDGCYPERIASHVSPPAMRRMATAAWRATLE
jgi:hypothetical protein